MDKEPHPNLNLRSQLVPALLELLAMPAIYSTASLRLTSNESSIPNESTLACAATAPANATNTPRASDAQPLPPTTTHFAHANSLQPLHTVTHSTSHAPVGTQSSPCPAPSAVEPSGSMVKSAAAAASGLHSGEPLFWRILHVLAALLPGGLAPWLRGQHEDLKRVV
eukprot:scaffold6169_cov19-Tisochrysis_lutea.AAC.1